ncbi:hypothetical protein SAMN05444354_101823 [Stigmatella aurantiaca]|uniref:Uncharacterized protein n=1 Tax=Stigmatella aurantiaca TaxID=41 RepID=A0A1H7HUS0_STIAU|nr:hypothetical protein SAMN05444354_101823 [Stigmatella aurantiaca]
MVCTLAHCALRQQKSRPVLEAVAHEEAAV